MSAARIKIDLRNGMKLNAALKIFKEKSKFITEELKERKKFNKKSVKSREMKLKATYKQQLYNQIKE